MPWRRSVALAQAGPVLGRRLPDDHFEHDLAFVPGHHRRDQSFLLRLAHAVRDAMLPAAEVVQAAVEILQNEAGEVAEVVVDDGVDLPASDGSPAAPRATRTAPPLHN
jgi:hypothetical protein